MNKGMKIVVAVLVVVVVGAGFGAYYHFAVAVPPLPAGNTITIASSATPSSLDPAVAFDTNSVFFDDQMYQSLLGYGTNTTNG